MSRRVHIILSAPELFGFMSGQPAALRKLGFVPTVISSASEWLDRRAGVEGIRRATLPIYREISLVHDVATFVRLCYLFYRESPDVVVLSGPKAIFLGGMAAWLCSVPNRISIYHGMRQENLRGPLRRILDLCDRISFACANHVLAVSPSLCELMVTRELLSPTKVSVIGYGTANGVNIARFSLTQKAITTSVELKKSLGIPEGAPIIGFVGRLTEDKGIADAYAAYLALRKKQPLLHFLLIGSDEMRTNVGCELLSRMRLDHQIRIVQHTDRVEDYLHLIWVQVFPSSREGFGMVIAEAAALAIPSVAYDVTGVRDAIVHGTTGVLVPQGDIVSLTAALTRYISDSELRRRHGLAGWSRVRQLFTPEHTWPSYLRALGFAYLPTPILAEPFMLSLEAETFEERERLLR